MDKFEYELKVEQIEKLIHRGDYVTAKKIADGMEFKKEKDTRLLRRIAELYIEAREYERATILLRQAYNTSPRGIMILERMIDVAFESENIDLAEECLEAYEKAAPDSPEYAFNMYRLSVEKKAPAAELIKWLEEYTSKEMDEEYSYRLAELYEEVGERAKCIKQCDYIIDFFCFGEYVDKAAELKEKFAELDEYQKRRLASPHEYEKEYKDYVKENDVKQVRQAREEAAEKQILEAQFMEQQEAELGEQITGIVEENEKKKNEISLDGLVQDEILLAEKSLEAENIKGGADVNAAVEDTAKEANKASEAEPVSLWAGIRNKLKKQIKTPSVLDDKDENDPGFSPEFDAEFEQGLIEAEEDEKGAELERTLLEGPADKDITGQAKEDVTFEEESASEPEEADSSAFDLQEMGEEEAAGEEAAQAADKEEAETEEPQKKDASRMPIAGFTVSSDEDTELAEEDEPDKAVSAETIEEASDKEAGAEEEKAAEEEEKAAEAEEESACDTKEAMQEAKEEAEEASEEASEAAGAADEKAGEEDKAPSPAESAISAFLKAFTYRPDITETKEEPSKLPAEEPENKAEADEGEVSFDETEPDEALDWTLNNKEEEEYLKKPEKKQKTAAPRENEKKDHELIAPDGNFMVACDNTDDGVKYATELVKRMNKDIRFETIAKIKASAFNRSKFGKLMEDYDQDVMLITNAAELTPSSASSILKWMNEDEDNSCILVDSGENLAQLEHRSPDFAKKFKAQYDYQAMPKEKWMEMVDELAKSENVILDDSAFELYDRYLTEREENGDVVVRQDLEDAFYNAVNKAEKFSIGNFFSGMVASKYDEDGNLILKAKYFD